MNEPIIFSEKKNVGVITLNLPQSLNSLTLEMCQKITSKLKLWKSSPTIQCILIKSSLDKAFCAGGDVVTLYQNMMKKNDHFDTFFKCEYKMDLMIHEYSKPIVVLTSGIVMGGGVGLANGASFRVVTETTRMAMPEITIGFYPDVGGSFFLPRMPGYTGRFAGLTGCRLNGTDCLYLKMADYFTTTNLLPQLETTLFELEFTENPKQDVKDVLNHFHQSAKRDLPDGNIELHLTTINELVNGQDPLEIKRKLQEYKSDDKWLTRSLESCLKGSPTSFAVILEQLQRGKTKTISEVFAMEQIITGNFAKNHDMKEGVRSLLIDKDNNPSWKPKNLEEVSTELVQSYFC